MKLSGTIPALVTPMKFVGDEAKFEINYEGLDQLLMHVIKGGVDGVLVAGCTGHAATLSPDEQVVLAKYTREKVDEINSELGKKVMVIAGDGSNCTREAVTLTRRIEDEAGVYMHLQISPYQNKPEQEGIFQHYRKVAKSIEGKIILYSVPGRTGGKGIMPETAYRLSEIDNIIAIKEASGDMDRILKTCELTNKNKNFAVMSGDDSATLDVMDYGGTGIISVAANVAPELVSKMVKYKKRGQHDNAMDIDEKLTPLFNVLFAETNPGPTHYALRKMGIDAGIPRLPLIDISYATKNKVEDVLVDLELIKR